MSPRTSILPRVWGTRFDTLPTTPPASPSTGEDSSHASERTATSDVSSSPVAPFVEERKEERTPHEASIFVGSLPTNIDQHELTRLLSEHLSEHTEIQNIKVVRDSKGGVCAFVQCQDATSASVLINTLQNRQPKTFLGRHLRYEPARAFRTLLISYRVPVQHAPINGSPNYPGYPHSNAMQEVQLDLPFAMRIWRNHGSKFHTLSYNAEAITSDAQDKQMAHPGKISLFLNPLNFDEDSIRSITTYFGDIEYFKSYTGNVGSDGIANVLPSPHDAPRANGMYPGCWEIKWKNRDDCVAALMTLRRVPHLTVTWAHQPSGSSFDNRNSSIHSRPHQNNAAYSFYVQLPQVRSASVQSQDSSAHGESTFRDPNEDTGVPQSGPDEDAGLSDTLQHLSLEPTLERLDWSETEVPATIPIQEAWKSGTWASKLSHPTSTQTTYSNTGIFDSPQYPPSTSVIASPLRKFGGNRVLHDIDPTTLFVGGLETLGSSAWTEEKLADFFNDYQGLENIRMVQPQNGNTGFAFIKFNNTESPERAVLEKHNSVVEGRAMRVQLREIHSPRNYWRHTRGRGRFQSNASVRRVTGVIARNRHEPEPASSTVSSPSIHLAGGSFGSSHEGSIQVEPPAYSEKAEAGRKDEVSTSGSKDQDDGEPAIPQSCSLTLPATMNPPTMASGSNNIEWSSDAPTVSGTPPVHLVPNAPVANPGFPYPTPYYHPSAWFHPYAQPIPYQMPYMAYSSQYHHAHPPQYIARPSQSDSPNPSVVPAWASAGPYAISPNPTPNNDHSQGQGLNSRAPLTPTGFLQNDQGTLIAVYQPEALDSYMTGSHRPPSDPQLPAAGGAASNTTWPHHPQPQGFPYPTPYHVMPPGQRQDVHVPIPNQVSGNPSQHSSTPNFGVIGATPDEQAHQNELVHVGPPPSHRRQSNLNRKDHNSGKFNHSHRYGQRQPRSNTQDARPNNHDSQMVETALPNFAYATWNQWGNGN